MKKLLFIFLIFLLGCAEVEITNNATKKATKTDSVGLLGENLIHITTAERLHLLDLIHFLWQFLTL